MIRNFAGCGNVAVEIEGHGAHSTIIIVSGLACRFNSLVVGASSFTHSTPSQYLESRRSPVVKRLIDCLFRRSRLTYFVFSGFSAHRAGLIRAENNAAGKDGVRGTPVWALSPIGDFAIRKADERIY